MAMDGTEKVLLSLGIRGMDPAEVRRLGQMTGDQLSNELRTVYARLEALHKAHKAATTAEEAKSVQAQIKEQQKLGQSVEKIVKQQQVALNKLSGSWRRVLEDLENITTIAQGMGGAINSMGALWSKFKDLGQEVIRTSNIFNALEGSILDAKIASAGQIANMDLMLAKNKAAQMDLALTSQEFATLAGFADQLGDATGTDAAEGLNTLVQALATGRTKALELAIGIIDNEQVWQKYANVIGKTKDKLTEVEKAEAIREEALGRMGKKLDAQGETALRLADNLERLFAAAKNAWDGLMASIGNSSALAKLADALTGPPIRTNSALSKMMREQSPAERAAAAEAADERFWQNIGGRGPKGARGGGGGDGGKAARERAARERGEQALRGFEHDVSVDRRMEDVADKRTMDDMDKRFRDAAGPDADFSSAMGTIGSGDVNALTEQLSAGAMAAEQWKAATGGAFDSVAASAQMMAGAAGEALAAMVVGLKDTSFKDRANQVMRALAAEAYTRSIMETALGLASLALGPIGGVSAGMHFAAAGAFAAVGTAAGLGARSLGPMASERGGRGGTTSVPTRSSGSGLPSGRTSGGSSDGDKSPIIMNFNNVLPGSEAEIGRVIEKSLEAHYRKSGRRPVN